MVNGVQFQNVKSCKLNLDIENHSTLSFIIRSNNMINELHIMNTFITFIYTKIDFFFYNMNENLSTSYPQYAWSTLNVLVMIII